MGGICGIIHFDDRPADAATLRSMERAGSHRAPDGFRRWVDGGCAVSQLLFHLAPQRAAGEETTASLNRRFVIVADARIDNREELRAELSKCGHPGSEATGADDDAALILGAYIRWGDEYQAHLVGDYAFAIWDRKERRLFAGRDPMALRPLYFSVESARLVFASEIEQVLAAGDIPKRLNRSMAAAWLLVKAGDPEWTFFEGIRQLPGAHRLTATASGVEVVRAWDVDPSRLIRYRNEQDYVEHLQELLVTATLARLQGTQPSGMFLSGGIDSCAVGGAVGWLMDNHADRFRHPFTTLAYRYEGFPQCDERHVSEPLARHWGMRIEEISSDEWQQNSLLDRRWDLDSPVLGIFRPLQDAALRRAQSQGIRQIFIAARGDNMVGGFLWDHAGLLATGAVTETWRELKRYRDAYRGGWRKAFRKTMLQPAIFSAAAFSQALADWQDRQHTSSLQRRMREGRLGDPWVAQELLHEAPIAAILAKPARHGFRNAASHARRNMVFDHFTELGNIQNERRVARYGLHYDDPWSDRRILEFVCAVPQHLLNRVDDTKRLARRALAGLVPPEVQQSAQKIIPADFGAHALREREQRSLRTLTTNMSAARAGLVDERVLAKEVSDFLDGGEFLSGVWSAVTLEAWLRFNDIDF